MNNWGYLKGATVERVKVEGDGLEMIFSNGARLEVHIWNEFDNSGYEFQHSDLVVEVIPPPAEKEGWIVIGGEGEP